VTGRDRVRTAAPLNPSRGTALTSALRRLARRDHSVGELSSALLRRGFPPEEVERVIESLCSRGLLDDRAFAERFARSRLERSGQNAIRAELRRRRVERETAESSLLSALGEVSEEEALVALARRYWASHGRDGAGRRIQKLHLFLLRRGYPAPLVSTKLRELWPEWSAELAEADFENEES